MYLKSLSIKNYRKYGEEVQTINFAHSKWSEMSGAEDESEKINRTEEYISKSSSLIVGKNNSGKSTIVKLLNTLQNTKSGSRNIFKYTDFNLKMLSDWYRFNIDNKSKEDIESIDKSDFPKLEFQLILGIDDENDLISSFEDILILGGIETVGTHENQEVAEVTIDVKYEVADVQSFLEELVKIKSSPREKIEQYDQGYQKELRYRKFLSLFSSNYFVLNFYPIRRDEPAKEFSLSSLLKVATIEANTVKNDKTLSQAYNKIVSTYIKNNDIVEIDSLVGDINYQVKDMVDTNIKDILQSAVSSIESTKNLKMNLHPDVTLEKIFANSIIYEYQEGNNNIPESQFGMGYTNLMVIIAKIVDYIELYSEKDINGSVNILCIEEPESFMHPQMQELFIKNISKAIATLLGKKQQLDTFQIIITTHSTHILNSKIQSGNTLNNISYLGQVGVNNIIKNVSDDKIASGRDIDKKAYEYIKKYLRLEITDIFFADAVVLVEGVSEETYLRYEIDRHSILKNHHVKVYRIDGAYAHQFISLLDLLGVRTVIFTDLDLKRSESEKKVDIKDNAEPDVIPSNIPDLEEKYGGVASSLTTNGTIQYFVKKLLNDDKAKYDKINSKIIEILTDKEELVVEYNNISMYSQCKINKYYATSFEEAIVLTNAGNEDENKYKKSLIKALQYVHPNMRYFGDIDETSEIADKSYMYQVKLSDGKSKFSTGIVYLSITDKEFSLKRPQYVESGLNLLCGYFEE
ncbi:TPA: AAA family ATPase [Streptococcus agalactiae]|uniref:AAA family ATPase n=1 Tax=Streptococcus agalactiae TaxID=1311 RepID=UPI0003172B23|nr:AAA family ATPase [Streptococcus agalactiae]EPW49244.1 ATP-dependent endonuclease [Streptococcus agalactiae LMG 15081]KLK69675.1 ATP-dependent endonuclease [Streptococcus agalactiae]SUN16045.1 putative ATP-dependent endonuclease of the OLDfamily [Streptococcus agalactiae]SUN36730.1 putative ATP-dependent endonuclease of the OLDfamily [Streptococcus agalactiae]HEO7878329.1 AAA family ATPase [Streptococcus agalactiae]